MSEFDAVGEFGKLIDALGGAPTDSPAALPGTWAQPASPSLGDLGPAAKVVKSAAGSPILEAGQTLIAGMRLTTGWGDPERGDPFGLGTARFTDAGETVASAYPGQDWQGSGAQAYATANRRQGGRIESMATLDRRAQTVIAREAYQVEYHRDKLDDQSNHLGDLSYVTWAMALLPGAGKAMQVAFELGAVKAAMSICGVELYRLSQEAGENAEELRKLAGEYSALSRLTSPPDLEDATPRQPTEVPSPADSADQPESERPTQIVVPGSLPTPPQSRMSAAPAAVPASPSGPALGPPTRPAASVAATAPPTEMISGMASAFGAVGGMLGAVAAPLTAALTGAAGAAGQSLSTLTSAGSVPGADDEGAPALEKEPPDTKSDDDGGLPNPAAGAGAVSHPPPPDVVGGSAEPQPPPARTAEPTRAPVPPAPTRPPR
ncbi:MAG: hypothetical protein K0U76_08415 [Actinomycetia bacterium]|nr:hypothetical protein [Actinomycetes bacterium]MCH9701400.1 hypothetical protein [Actinomycetes bacterium]MCH9760884.1 hypothetical protein [Actinomycetes bacterium]